jgi:hypothetical protein
VNGRIYHPGDSLQVPGHEVDVLLAPVHGSWLKTAEVIDFMRAVQPTSTYGIHEAQLNDRGLSAVNEWLTEESQCGYQYLTPGSGIALDPRLSSPRF